MRRGVNNLPDLMASIKQAISANGDYEQRNDLGQFFYEIDARPFLKPDPFGPDFKNMMLDLYKIISSKDFYDPAVSEKTNALDEFDVSRCPWPYRTQDSRMVGDFLTCYGWILSTLNVKSGAATLEYGSGDGQLAIHLARMGCDVHAIDIEPRFLDAIQKQCKAVGVNIQTRVGQFGEGFDEKKFDRVIFFEAFHHCLDHHDALMRIRHLIKPDGYIIFSGEPIIPRQSPDKETVPYPWGLRLDGEAVRSIAEFGWMELGYSEDYFVELLARTGYSVELTRCPSAWRADTYIGRPFDGKYPLERNTLIQLHDQDSGWHDSEGTHRWTNGNAVFPLPNLGYSKAQIELSNWGPERMNVALSCSDAKVERQIASGEAMSLTVDVPEGARHLRIASGRFQPSSANPASQDTRTLGVAVRSIEFLR